MKKLGVVFLMAAALTLSACGDDDDTVMYDAPPVGMDGGADAPVGMAPTVVVTLAPAMGAAGVANVHVVATVTNWTWHLPATPNPPNTANHGHAHVFWHDMMMANERTSGIGVDANGTATVTGSTAPAHFVIPNLTGAGATAGGHEVHVQLYQNDHTVLNPAVHAFATFTVQ